MASMLHGYFAHAFKVLYDMKYVRPLRSSSWLQADIEAAASGREVTFVIPRLGSSHTHQTNFLEFWFFVCPSEVRCIPPMSGLTQQIPLTHFQLHSS
jgi:hypothetical protein